MCFEVPYKYTHTDRHTDANGTICTFLSQFYNLPYPKIWCRSNYRIYNIWGKSMGASMCWVFPLFLVLTFIHTFLYLMRDHCLWNQVPDHIIKLIHKCKSILIGTVMKNTPISTPNLILDIKHFNIFV